MTLLKKKFFFQDIKTLKGIGPVISKYLKKKKIDKIKDVVLNIPYSETDRSKISFLSSLASFSAYSLVVLLNLDFKFFKFIFL